VVDFAARIPTMAKFGMFTAISSVPLQEYDGDYMKQTGEYVTILKRNPNSGMADEQLAAVCLEKGYGVKKISD
jgi:hypothetical protein